MVALMKTKLTAESARVELGSAIAARRDSLGLNQTDFATKADLTQATVSRVESGKMWPSDETLVRILNALEISFGDLFSV